MPVVHHFMSMPSDLYRSLCAIAEERRSSLTDVINEALCEMVEERQAGARLLSPEQALELSARNRASLLMSYSPRFRSVQ